MVTHDSRVAGRASRRLWLEAGTVASSRYAAEGSNELAPATAGELGAVPVRG
jgi:ABC-type lipoprotein export system ATPase subunit